MPPSAITGIPASRQARAASAIAVNLRHSRAGDDTRSADDPGPIPTLMAQPRPSPAAGALISALHSRQAIDFWKFGFYRLNASNHAAGVAVCAVDRQHVPLALTISCARSRKSPVAPMAHPRAAARAGLSPRPGISISFWMSFDVIRPFRLYLSSTTSSFFPRDVHAGFSPLFQAWSPRGP